MFVSHRDQIPKKVIESPSLKGVEKQVLIGPEQGWQDHVMRMFTLAEGGYSPRHSHSWPHIIYCVEGEGVLYADGKEYPLSAGSTAYVDGMKEHQLIHAAGKQFVFICIVPKEGDM